MGELNAIAIGVDGSDQSPVGSRICYVRVIACRVHDVDLAVTPIVFIPGDIPYGR